MNVGDILRTKQTRLVSVRLSDTVQVAVQRLHAEGVGAVIVQDVCHTESNTVVGMLSERDLVCALAEQGPSVLQKRVTNFIKWQVYTCAPGDAIEKALGSMLEHCVRYLPVLERFTLIGVISMRDIALRLAKPEVDEPQPAMSHV